MTEEIRPHYRLEAWKEAMVLVRSVYEMSRHFPAEERYGLSAQMKRSAVSVPSNIAERIKVICLAPHPLLSTHHSSLITHLSSPQKA
jgi:hypothetical protein